MAAEIDEAEEAEVRSASRSLVVASSSGAVRGRGVVDAAEARPRLLSD
jgi:hypothetical protein